MAASAVLALSIWISLVGARSPAAAEDYPQWRGPQRTGISHEKGFLTEWPKEGPKLLWQVKNLGFGFGTPALADGRIYLVGNRENDNEFVQALDVRDGSLLWTTRIGKVGNADQQPSHPGARSTPTVEGELLYALGSDGGLACLECATGKIRWQKSLRADFGGQPGAWAYAESPLIDGDVLVCTPGGAAATLVALNKKTGDVLWKSAVPGGDQAGYASAIAVELGGVRQYVQFLQKGLVGVDAKTGKFLWRFDKAADLRMGINAATPVASDGCVYSAAGMAGGGLARIKADSGSFTAEAVYVARKLPNALGGSVKVGDSLYGATNSALLCIDFMTGNLKWEDRCVGAGSICCADGRLYVHGENGEVALVEATSEAYREKGRFTPPDPPERAGSRAWSYPVIANGRLYLRDLGTLWCYDIRASAGASGP
jgi:outer membrane protein assembly factor BamB